jgi:hypothetical protein
MKTKTEVNEDKYLEREQSARYTLKEMIDRYERCYTDKKDYYQKKRDKSIFKHLRAFFGEGSNLKAVSSNVGLYQPWREEQITNPWKSSGQWNNPQGIVAIRLYV